VVALGRLSELEIERDVAAFGLAREVAALELAAILGREVAALVAILGREVAATVGGVFESAANTIMSMQDV
jgi:hypothetical protein